VLLCTGILSGWIWPSILRYFPASLHKKSFMQKSMLLSCITQSIFFLPVLLAAWYIEKDFLLALFFSLALFITSLQFSVLALSQSVFLSKKSIYAEIIRTGTYISCSLLLLKFSTIGYMYALFTAIIISYISSFAYLYIQINRQLLKEYTDEDESRENIRELFRRFMFYGGPLALWFVFGSSISLVDKYFMLKRAGGEAQGNYQAMFDFLSKSITFFISPVITSLFPLLTAAFEKGERKAIRKILIQIIAFEFAGLLAAGIAYWWFGAGWLFALVHTPDTFEYKLTGLIIIAATFIWQIAIMVQKKYELQIRSRHILYMLMTAFLVQVLFYVFSSRSSSQLLYPLGYLLSTVVYLLLISFSDIVILLKSFFRKVE
jgi:O-antigen/teichoic acid export membrane protein